ncbi:MAG: hypothetical protein RTU92_04600 [Candidatus Thorarchaeota archaeon]
MPEQLEIDDGDPVWNSPDIWTVPGDDPNGPVGSPVAGGSTWIWAQVHNQGKDPSENARVKFYWGDPSTIVTRDTAHLVGTSQVRLDPGESKDVLCVTRWIPVLVNDGHECLIVEVFSPTDPLTSYGDNYFHVADDRHVAQRNVTVLPAPSPAPSPPSPFFMFSAAHDGRYNDKQYEARLIARRTKLGNIKEIIEKLGLKKMPAESESIADYGIIPYKCGESVKSVGKKELSIKLSPKERIGLALAIETSAEFEMHEAALFTIDQYSGEKLSGGITVLITGTNSPKRKEGK